MVDHQPRSSNNNRQERTSLSLRKPYGYIDYHQLANQVPEFEPFLCRTNDPSSQAPCYTINYQDENAVRALTKALLKRDFGLAIDLPENRLCPMIPGRLEYVLFVLTLAMHYPQDPGRLIQQSIRGIDIGTGASSIYPLLALETSPIPIHMFATEIDTESFEYARKNIELNHPADRSSNKKNRIELIKIQDKDETIIPLDRIDSDHEEGIIDFVMCNPPFYNDQSEIEASFQKKEKIPIATCTGSSNEMITQGGEVQFVGGMIQESVQHQNKIRWYTSLIGKISSLESLVKKLKALQIQNYAIHALKTGRTVRHILIWSLGKDRIPCSQINAPSPRAVPSSLLPKSNRFHHDLLEGSDPNQILEKIQAILRDLEDIRIVNHDDSDSMGHQDDDDDDKNEKPMKWSFWLGAKKNSWSRSARRKRKRMGEAEVECLVDCEGDKVDFDFLQVQFSLVVRDSDRRLGKVKHVPPDATFSLISDWIKGEDSVWFDYQALWSFLLRKLSDEPGPSRFEVKSRLGG